MPGPQRADVLTVAFDPRGHPTLSHRQTLQVRFPPASRGIRYETFSRLDLKPGRYQIRVAATSAERTGSVFADVDVPDYTKDRLSMSGLILATDAAVEAAAREAVADLLPATPTARRDFTSSDHLRAFARLYQGGNTPVLPATVAWRIVDATNRPVTGQSAPVDAASFGAARRVDYAINVPLASLAPGSYLLTVEGAMGQTRVHDDVKFSVR